MIISRDAFIKKYKEAPEKIQEWMGNDVVTKTIAGFENTFSLTKEQRRTTADAVGAVLIGFLHPKDFVPSLEKELGVSNEVAKKIALEVNKEIFSEVKDELITLYSLDTKQNQKQSSIKNPDIKNTYNTSPDLFEKKLQQTVIKQPINNAIKNTHEEQTPKQQDSYREPVE